MPDLVLLPGEQCPHVLLEVPPGCRKEETLGLSDEELLYRLSELDTRNQTKLVARKFAEVRGLMEGRTPRRRDGGGGWGGSEGEAGGNEEGGREVVARDPCTAMFIGCIH